MLIAISAPARSIEATAMSISRSWMTSRIGMWSTSTSYIDRSTLSGSTPWLIVRLPCGSKSMHRTSWPDSENATARFSVVVVFATPPFWFANEMIFARRSDWSPMCAPGGRPAPGRRTGAIACWAVSLSSSPSCGSVWFMGGLDLDSASTGSGSVSGVSSGSGSEGSGSEGVGSAAGCSSITSASASASGSGAGTGWRSSSSRSASWGRLSPWPLVDHSSPDRGTSCLEPRLKRPIDRDYSHALVGFLPVRDKWPYRGLPAARPSICPAMPELLDKRLVIVTGKGGVGKSTVALAMGLAAAAEGRRTIICEVSSQEHTSHVFNRAEVGFHEVEMAENLWSISIDPDEAMREYILLQLKVRAMRDLLFRSRIFNYLAAATPGLRELVTIGKIWEVALPDRKVKKGREYDLVIVDAPATGHGVAFLQTPRTFANVARVGPIKAQAEALETFLVNHRKTGVAIVALPEEMPVNETASLERTLTEEVGVSVDRVYMNALYPERFSAEEAEHLESVSQNGNGALRAACRAAISERRRSVVQREQLARLAELVNAPVRTLPFMFEPELGVEEIRELAEVLD